MSNTDIVKRLADGHRVCEIAAEFKVNKRTVEARIVLIRERMVCKTTTQLVAVFLRKKLIN